MFQIKPVNSKGNQPWIFISRTDAEAEAPILWPRDVRSWLSGKDPYAGKDWGQEEKGTTEKRWDGWMASLTNGFAFEQTPEDSDGQGGWRAAVHGVTVRCDLATELNWTWTWNTIIGMLVYWIWQWRKRWVKENSRFLKWTSRGLLVTCYAY